MKTETYPFSRLFFFLFYWRLLLSDSNSNLPAVSTLNSSNPPLISFITILLFSTFFYIYFLYIEENLRYIINILFCWVVFVITIIIIITIVTSLLWIVIMYVIIICNLKGDGGFLFYTPKYGIYKTEKQSYFIYSIYILGSIWVNFLFKLEWRRSLYSISNVYLVTNYT